LKMNKINSGRAQTEYILTDDYIGNRHCYGIAASVTYDTVRIILDKISDFSSDRVLAMKTVKLCNQFKLDPIHLRDVVYDIASSR